MIVSFIQLVVERLRPGMVVCEVGCHAGASTIGWLPVVAGQGGRGIAVDWFYGNPDVSDGQHGWRPDGADEVYKLLLQVTAPFTKQLIVYKGESTKIAKLMLDRSIDVCFIDADHRYEAVKADLEAWEPKVKKGGVLAGHDMDCYPPPFKPSPEQLARDCIGNMHYGVMWAVWERFGKDVEVRPDPLGPPIWVKKL